MTPPTFGNPGPNPQLDPAQPPPGAAEEVVGKGLPLSSQGSQSPLHPCLVPRERATPRTATAYLEVSYAAAALALNSRPWPQPDPGQALTPAFYTCPDRGGPWPCACPALAVSD